VPPEHRNNGLVSLFGTTLFVGAALTFLIQPMVAKMVLPLYGGSSGVWTTCMLFFQAALLGGYAYAHVGSKTFGVRRHAVIHLILILAVLLFLPIGGPASWAPMPNWPPSLSLLTMLAARVGLPYLAVAGTAPLLQLWFAETRHHSASDPYFLYASSNLGSMLALLGYPLLVEKVLPLEKQVSLWLSGYTLLSILVTVCALTLRSRPQDESRVSPEGNADMVAASGSPPSWRQRRRWIALAFIPSSLLLSVTAYLTTDVAAIPLLWVVPFALYLLTYILAFAVPRQRVHRAVSRLLPLVVLLLTLLLLAEGLEPPIWLQVGLHLLGLFVIGFACHVALALSRPSVASLTEFYLWLSVGGVLGGLFNALLAPVLFMRTGLTEYPLVLVLACFVRPPVTDKQDRRTLLRKDLLPAAILGLLTAVLAFSARWMPADLGPLRVGLAFGIPAVLCYTFVDRPVRFGLGIAALLLAGAFYVGEYGNTVYLRRTFFGVHQITRDERGRFLKLVHGNTVHGQQSAGPAVKHEPLTYYHVRSPIGRLFESLNNSSTPPKEVAVAGLGAGSLAYYAQRGQHWTFFEIDPVVEHIARAYFSYLKECDGDVDVVLGDARLRLEQAQSSRYDVLVIDAFNSDSIPIHLLTREAVATYRKRLADDGIMAFHVSNRHLDLAPVLAAQAETLGLAGYQWLGSSDPAPDSGKFASHWVLLGRLSPRLDAAIHGGMWTAMARADERYLWTDSYSNLLSVIRWAPSEVP
jgi:hypothetical protein